MIRMNGRDCVDEQDIILWLVKIYFGKVPTEL
jgi:hypothetical protein